MDTVHNILRRKSYVGIRQFSSRDGKKGESPAVWQPIISSEKFNMAQAILDRNRHHKRGYLSQRYPYTLSGICFCKTCGDRLSGKSAHSKGKNKFPYYEHSLNTRRQATVDQRIITCDPPRVPAGLIEPLVWQEVKRFLCNEDIASQVMTIAQVMRPNDHMRADEDRLRKQLLTSERQIEALVERIARLPKEVDERTFLNQLTKLQDEKRITEIKLAEYRSRPPEQTGAIEYDNFAGFAINLLELMNYANNHGDIQAAIIRHLVHRINVSSTGFEIVFFNGKTHVAKELG